MDAARDPGGPDAIARDPSTVAQQHGVATGRCCFCGRLLSTAESRSAGYGPDCADRFGLPWGSTAVADEADEQARAETDQIGRRDQLARDAMLDMLADPIGPEEPYTLHEVHGIRR